MSDAISLGDGHVLRFFRWAPDDLPENRECYGFPLPVIEKAGATIKHPNSKTGEPCLGVIHFDIPSLPVPIDHKWKVESWEPLTLLPSILCSCGDHGFIRNGKWEKA